MRERRRREGRRIRNRRRQVPPSSCRYRKGGGGEEEPAIEREIMSDKMNRAISDAILRMSERLGGNPAIEPEGAEGPIPDGRKPVEELHTETLGGSTTDRRRGHRLPSRLKLDIHWPKIEEEDARKGFYTIDVSATGLLFSSPIPFPLQQVLELLVYFPKHPKPSLVRTRVVRVTEAPGEDRFRIGVTFTEQIKGTKLAAAFAQYYDFSRFLKSAVEMGASDVHLTRGHPVLARCRGEIVPMKTARFDEEDIEHFIVGLLNEKERRLFDTEQVLDFSFEVAGLGRFRANVHRQRGRVEAVFRVLPREVPTLEALHLPKTMARLAMLQGGLVLVCGPVRSGKSTTLAALIEEINRTRRAILLSVEDPLEQVIPSRQSVIKQMEVGTDVASFAEAARNALRQDPDVLVVGDIPDPETMLSLLRAARSRITVFAGVTAESIPAAFDTLLTRFPPALEGEGYNLLLRSLRAVVCQQLIPRRDGKGVVPAVEFLLNTPPVATCLRARKWDQLTYQLQNSAEMLDLDTSVRELWLANLIDWEIASSMVSNPTILKQR
ncbi:MAG: hypothetical protein D6812_05800 [Deltaproteobacteria bacterium]|nr:MAG: hypothetical protein D6812_05800 [Deltaproteobacteria bacterium]